MEEGEEQVLTKISSIFSRLMPLVSGIRNQTKKNLNFLQSTSHGLCIARGLTSQSKNIRKSILEGRLVDFQIVISSR